MSVTRASIQQGFTLIEVIVSAVIIAITSTSILGAYSYLSQTYALTRQLNEVYAVLSSCPEIDRALQYENISGTTNCFPNNIFQGEGVSTSTITYTPSLSVTNTAALSASDPLHNVADSKVVDISTSLPNAPHSTYRVRLLITRNGIGQQ